MDILHSFFLRLGFVPMGFTDKVFNEAVVEIQKNIVLFFPSLRFFFPIGFFLVRF